MPENQKLLSIIIPVYNVENYVASCLESVLVQFNDNIEMIIVDDGSTDDSLKICSQYYNKYPKLRVIHQENRGLSEARNTGINNATGKYILFLDSDDLLTKDAVSSLVDIINQNDNNTEVIASGINLLVNNKLVRCKYINDFVKLNNIPKGSVYGRLYQIPGIIVGAWMFTVNRKFLIDNNLYFKSGIYHEDEEWIPRLFLNAEKIVFNDYPTYIYRQSRDNSIIHSLNIKKELDKLRVVQDTLQYIDNYPLTEEKKAISNKMCNLVYSAMVNAFSYKKDDQYSELLILLNKNIVLFKNSSIRTYKILWRIYKLLGIRSCVNVAFTYKHLREKNENYY